ncbi:MAG: hypothetical protein JW940_34705 [Polyangiaceae bacterium]|nr:hypothetical protein [Polyangiaceae bacterium]
MPPALNVASTATMSERRLAYPVRLLRPEDRLLLPEERLARATLPGSDD